MDMTKDTPDMELWMQSVTERLDTLQLTLDRIKREHLMIGPNTLLDVVDIAAIMKMTPKAVYNWVYKERIKSVKIGGRRMFLAKDLIDPKELMR